MKLLNIINKIVNIRKLFLTLFILLWVILFSLTAVKLLFNYWYPIVVNNGPFMTFCNFIDKHEPIKFIIGMMFYMVTFIMFNLISTSRFKIKPVEIIIVTISGLICYTLKYFFPICIILEILVLFIPVIIFNIRNTIKKYYYIAILYPIIIYLIINIYQLNILFVRGLKDILTELPMVITYTMQLDYYIFLIILWIGGNLFMGWISIGFFFGKSETELLAMREAELLKPSPNKAYLNKIERTLERIREKAITK